MEAPDIRLRPLLLPAAIEFGHGTRFRQMRKDSMGGGAYAGDVWGA